MRIIAPDFDRVVDRPGAGPCPRPVEASSDPAALEGLRLLIDDIADGLALEEETGEDEVLLVLIAGAVAVTVSGPHEGTYQLDADGDWALHLPPRHRCRVEPFAPSTLASARVPAEAASAPRAFAPREGVLSVAPPAARLRLRLLPLAGEDDASAGLGDAVARLAYLGGPATLLSSDGDRDLPPAHVLALSPGENATVRGDGELLVVAALGKTG